MKSTEEKYEGDIFYKSSSEIIPYSIKEDFIDNNFLIIFVNPLSGSQEGKIILDYVKNYKQVSINTFNIIHFPIEEDSNEDSFLFPLSSSRTNSVQSFDEIFINNNKKNIERPTKFDPSIPFSVIIFNGFIFNFL